MSQKYRVQLSDGRAFEVETEGGPPSESDLQGYLAAPPPDSAGLGKAVREAGGAPPAPLPSWPPKPPPPQDPVVPSTRDRLFGGIQKALETPLFPRANPQAEALAQKGADAFSSRLPDPEGAGAFAAATPQAYNQVIQPQSSAPNLAMLGAGVGVLPKAAAVAANAAFGGEALKGIWQHLVNPNENWIGQKGAGVLGNLLMAIAAAHGMRGEMAGAPAAAEAAAPEVKAGVDLNRPTMTTASATPSSVIQKLDATQDAQSGSIPAGPGAAPGQVADAASQVDARKRTPLGWFLKPTQVGGPESGSSWTMPIAPGMVKGEDGVWRMTPGRPGGTSTSMDLPLQDTEAAGPGPFDRRAKMDSPALTPAAGEGGSAPPEGAEGAQPPPGPRLGPAPTPAPDVKIWPFKGPNGAAMGVGVQGPGGMTHLGQIDILDTGFQARVQDATLGTFKTKEEAIQAILDRNGVKGAAVGGPSAPGSSAGAAPEGQPSGQAAEQPEPTWAPGEDNTTAGLNKKLVELMKQKMADFAAGKGPRPSMSDPDVQALQNELRRRAAAQRGASTLGPTIRAGAIVGGAAAGAAAPDDNATTGDRVIAGLLGAAGGYVAGDLITGGGKINAGAANQAARVADNAISVLSPQSRGPAAALAAQVYQAAGGSLARAQDVARQAFKPFDDVIAKLSEQDRIGFMIDTEKGRTTPIVALRPLQGLFRQELDQRAVILRSRNLLEQTIDDYFPHLWKNKGLPAGTGAQTYEEALAQASSRGNTPGVSSAFQQHRTISQIEDGLNPNRPGGPLELASTNPIDVVLTRLRQMDRAIQLDDVRTALNANGYRVQMREAASNAAAGAVIPPEAAKGRIPPGWVVDPDPRQGGWIMPEPAARILASQMGVGSLRGNAAFDAAREIGNSLNQASLSLSGFHAGFSAFNSSISKAAAGTMSIVNGLADPSVSWSRYLTENLPTGAKLIGKGVVPLWAPIEDLVRGDKAMTAWATKNPQGQYWADYVNNLMRAGARANLDDFYQGHYWKGFKDAVAGGQWDDAILKFPQAALERTSAPLMQWAIPRLKFGAFGDLMQVELQRLGPGASEAQIKTAMQAAWNSVDNRFGQLVYDNLFWHPAAKDLAMTTMRSAGWNIGTVREVVGGAADVAKAPLNIARGQQALSPKAAYAVALGPMTAAFSGIYHFLHTGEAPSEPLDWWAPKTGFTNEDGDAERVIPPSYLTRDVQSFLHDQTGTVLNKIHPLLRTGSDLVRNEDWKGTQIYNPADSLLGQKGLDMAKYVGSQAIPITIENILNQAGGRGREGGGLLTEPGAEQFFGLNPEPKWMTRDPGRQLALELKGQSAPRIRTQGQEAANATRRTARLALAKGDTDTVGDMISSGQLDSPTALRLAKQAGQPAISAITKGMKPDDLLKVYNASKSDEDKAVLRPALGRWLPKLGSYADLPPEERKELMDKILQILKPPAATEGLGGR